MKFLSSEKLSQHKYKTPEGYLICTDAILARTGKQEYRRNEVFMDSDDDSIIEVDRTVDEVFSPQTLASFENKPVCVEHPDVDVTAENHNELAVGFVRDVRQATVDGNDVMIGNLVITDEKAIELIESGEMTELSCGYDCDIVDEENPQQRNIRGNHVALCEQGRAGIARIVDSVKAIKDSTYSFDLSQGYDLDELRNDASIYNLSVDWSGRGQIYNVSGRRLDIVKLLREYNLQNDVSSIVDSAIRDERISSSERIRPGETIYIPGVGSPRGSHLHKNVVLGIIDIKNAKEYGYKENSFEWRYFREGDWMYIMRDFTGDRTPTGGKNIIWNNHPIYNEPGIYDSAIKDESNKYLKLKEELRYVNNKWQASEWLHKLKTSNIGHTNPDEYDKLLEEYRSISRDFMFDDSIKDANEYVIIDTEENRYIYNFFWTDDGGVYEYRLTNDKFRAQKFTLNEANELLKRIERFKRGEHVNYPQLTKIEYTRDSIKDSTTLAKDITVGMTIKENTSFSPKFGRVERITKGRDGEGEYLTFHLGTFTTDYRPNDKVEVKDSVHDAYYSEYDKKNKEFVKNAIAEMTRYIRNWDFMSPKEKRDIGSTLSELNARVKELRESLNDSKLKDSLSEYAILHPTRYEFLSVGGKSWVKEDSTMIQKFNSEKEAIEFANKNTSLNCRIVKFEDSNTIKDADRTKIENVLASRGFMPYKDKGNNVEVWKYRDKDENSFEKQVQEVRHAFPHLVESSYDENGLYFIQVDYKWAANDSKQKTYEIKRDSQHIELIKANSLNDAVNKALRKR